MRRWLRVIWSGMLLVGGTLLCLRVARPEQWRGAWTVASRLGAPLWLLLLLPFVSLFIKSLGWRALLPARSRPSVARCFSTFLAAQGVNELGFSILGEPLKVLVLPGDARSVGAAAVAADNAVAFAALLSVSATLAVCREPVTLLALGLLGFSIFVVGQVSPWFPRHLIGFSAHFVGKLWLALELGLGLYFLGEPALAAVIPLSFAWNAAAALGAPVPGQIGVVETALLRSGAAVGIAATSLLTLALVRRVRALLWMVLGLFLAARLINRTHQEVKDASPSVVE